MHYLRRPKHAEQGFDDEPTDKIDLNSKLGFHQPNASYRIPRYEGQNASEEECGPEHESRHAVLHDPIRIWKTGATGALCVVG